MIESTTQTPGDGEPPPTEGRIIQTTLEHALRTTGSLDEALGVWADIAPKAIKAYRSRILPEL